MIFVFCEDSRLEIVEDEAKVVQSYEGLDVLSGIYQFFSEDGSHLAAVFDVPVKQSRLLWFIRTINSGKYHLEESKIDDDDPLWLAFLEADYIEPNNHFSTVEEAQNYLRDKGASVDAPPGHPNLFPGET